MINLGKTAKQNIDTIPKEQLQEIANKSINYYDMAKLLGKKQVTRIFKETLKLCCEEKGIDVSHFMGDNYKRCTKCGKIKPISEFYVINKNMIGSCKDCWKISSRNKYRQLKEENFNFKKQYSCKKCGESRYYLLEFHHRDKEGKSFDLSDKSRASIQKYKNELDKCDVLCCNCHREWHFIEKHRYKFEPTTYEEWLNKNIVEIE